MVRSAHVSLNHYALETYGLKSSHFLYKQHLQIIGHQTAIASLDVDSYGSNRDIQQTIRIIIGYQTEHQLTLRRNNRRC